MTNREKIFELQCIGHYLNTITHTHRVKTGKVNNELVQNIDRLMELLKDLAIEEINHISVHNNEVAFKMAHEHKVNFLKTMIK